MKALVVYESLFGNTRAVAEAIGAGLGDRLDASTIVAADVDTALAGACDLLVIGSPTHGHGLPSAQSRTAGLKSGVSRAIVEAPGIRELLTRLPAGGGRSAAAFDTSLRGPRWLWGAASRPIARALTNAGYALVLPPETFLIRGMKVPTITDTELKRASNWGALLARELPAQAGGKAA